MTGIITTDTLKISSLQKKDGTTTNASALGLHAGSVVKTTCFPTFNNLQITHSTSYGNNRSNYRDLGSSYHQDVTVLTDNPILLVTGAIGVYGFGGSHTYFDFYVEGDTITNNWLSIMISTTSADGLQTNHMGTNSDNHPMPVQAAWQTDLSAGDTVTFKPQVSSWGSSNIFINQYVTAGNTNMIATTSFVCQEITT